MCICVCVCVHAWHEYVWAGAVKLSGLQTSYLSSARKKVGWVFSSVQFSRSVVSDSLQPRWLQHTSLSITNSQSLLKLMSIRSVMPSNHLILCCPLHLLPSIFPSIRVCSDELVLHIRWPKYWSFNFSISPSNKYTGLIPFRMGVYPLDWISLQSKGLSRVFSNTTIQKSILRHSAFLK